MAKANSSTIQLTKYFSSESIIHYKSYIDREEVRT